MERPECFFGWTAQAQFLAAHYASKTYCTRALLLDGYCIEAQGGDYRASWEEKRLCLSVCVGDLVCAEFKDTCVSLAPLRATVSYLDAVCLASQCL